MSSLRQMLVFVTVVENGTFAAAAEILNISPVAVSKQISSLEKKCQQTLFNRSTRRMAITDFARQYYQACKKTIHSMQEAEKLVESQSDKLHGSLKIHCLPFIAGHCIFPLLKTLTKQHPSLSVQITIGDDIPNLVEKDIDLLIGYSPKQVGTKQNLRCCQLFSTEYALAASPAYLKETGMPKCRQDLYNHRFIHDVHLPQPFALSFHDGEVLENLNTALTLGDGRMICLAAFQQVGIAYVARKAIFPELISRNLIEIFPSSLAGEANFSAFYKHSEIESPKIKLFLTLLTQSIKKNQAYLDNAVMAQIYTPPYAKD